jgi:hypothetical protein
MSRFALAAAERATHEHPGFRLDADLLAATIGANGLDHIEAASRAFVGGKPRDDPGQTLSHSLLGVALLLRDEPAQAAVALAEGRRLAVAHELPLMVAHCLVALADAAMAAGEEPKALAFIRESRELTVRYRLDSITTTAPIFTTSAVGYVHEGRFADARREAARAVVETSLRMRLASRPPRSSMLIWRVRWSICVTNRV